MINLTPRMVLILYEILIVIDNLVNHITKHIKIKGKITHFATNLLILQQLLKKFRKFGERPLLVSSPSDWTSSA